MPFTSIPSSRFCESHPRCNLVQHSFGITTRQSFQLIVWLVPSFTAAAISVTMIGVLLGPMYPIAINHTARVLPRHLVNGTIGWISACGAGGSALLPFLTGAMASKLGIESLQPLYVVFQTFLFP
jgi:fucose permease